MIPVLPRSIFDWITLPLYRNFPNCSFCVAIFLWPSEFILVPSGIPPKLQVCYHQDLEYDRDLECTVLINWHEKHYAHADAVEVLIYRIVLLSFTKFQKVHNICMLTSYSFPALVNSSLSRIAREGRELGYGKPTHTQTRTLNTEEAATLLLPSFPTPRT